MKRTERELMSLIEDIAGWLSIAAIVIIFVAMALGYMD